MAPEVAVEAWQEQVIRRACAMSRVSAGPLSAAEIGVLCGRSKTWARAALRLLGLTTPRMRAYRAGGAR